MTFQTILNKNYTFYFEVPVECDYNIGRIVSDMFEGYISLVSGEETKLEITISETGKTSINQTSSLQLSSYDITNRADVSLEMLYSGSFPTETFYTMDTNEFADCIIERLKKKIEIPANDSLLSEHVKIWISNECKLFILNTRLLDYKSLFYDLLVTNAYAEQFNNESRPLSEKQIENINRYFKNKEIVKILLAKNDEVIKLDGNKKFFELKINETPKVPKELLMAEIISKYSDKVVIVDFWATWCAPCLEGIKRQDKIKDEVKGKEVIFVYITNSSSPHELWEKKIIGIGGEQYYLNEEEWEYLTDNLGFDAIPTCLIYDKKGKLLHKHTGIMNNTMELINKAL